MLNSYLKQKAAYKAAVRDSGGMVMDEWGQPQFLNEVTIPCRSQPKVQEVITADKQIIKTSTVYYLSGQVFEGDLLDGKRVESVSQWNSLGGTPMGWKAAV